MRAMQKSILLLEYAGPEMQDLEEVISEAVTVNGTYLRFASERLRGNREIAELAVRQNAKAFVHVDPALRKDELFVNRQLKHYEDRVENLRLMLKEKKYGSLKSATSISV